jgi:CheY-like chemotaxis protein
MPSERTVLVVEDTPSNFELVEAALDGTGLRLVCADTAAAARSWLAHNVPWLILMDIDLPDGNGLDLTRELRGDRRLAGVRVIALTAIAMSGFDNDVMDAGCDEYLTKPIIVSQLVARVLAQASD